MVSKYRSSRAWIDMLIEPSVRQAAGTGVPAFEVYQNDGISSRGVFLYSFTDESVAGNQKEVFFTLQTPHGWAATPIYMHTHWIPYASATGKKIEWGLEYTWAEPGVAYAATQIIYAATWIPADADFVALRHYLSPFAAITPSASQDGLSSILMGRIFRNSSGANDDYANKIGLLYIDAHLELDAVGSITEFTK